jgi:hypothetical protein
MTKRSTSILFAFLLAATAVIAAVFAPREGKTLAAPEMSKATSAPPAGAGGSPVAVPESQKVAQRSMAAAVQSAMIAPASLQDESSLMGELRKIRQSDPELSLWLAREGNMRFPESTSAAERASIVVKSLMRMGRVAEATAEAKAMVEKFPGTTWAVDVRHHMLDIPSYVPKGMAP